MSALSSPLPIATRKSPLALAQALEVQALLAKAHGVAERDKDAAFPILGLVSTGDKIQDRTLLEAGGKGLFTKEIDEAQLDGRAAFAVHSMKDVPTTLPAGLELGAVLEREDPRDVLISSGGETRLEDLPEGCVFGTASLRRQSQLLNLRPDIKVIPLRGNVGTRLSKLAAGEVHATFLAKAGLNRLGHQLDNAAPIDPDTMLPAAAQGAVGVTIRSGDKNARALLEPLHHAPTALAIAAERGFLAALDGSCRTPIAAYVNNVSMDFTAEVLTPDGQMKWRESRSVDMSGLSLSDADQIGRELGAIVKSAAGEHLSRVFLAS